MTRRRVAIAVAAHFALLATAASASADTFVADPTVPGTTAACVAQENGGSPCSLLGAIGAASAEIGAVVKLDPGTFHLTTGALPYITGTVDVEGAGEGTSVIDAAGNGRPNWLFSTDNGGHLTLRNLTIQHAATMDGTLYSAFPNDQITLDHVTLTGDSSVGSVIYITGTLRMDDSTLSGSSPANLAPVIDLAEGYADIERSTFAKIDAPASPLLLAYHSLGTTIVDSTFADDTTAFGIELISGVSHLLFDTFTGLTVQGSASSAVIEASNFAQPNLRGDVFADHQTECSDPSHLIRDGGANFSDDATCGFTAPGDTQNGDPQLGALADNGSAVATAQPAPSSPLINGAGPCQSGDPVVDARGFPRPQGSACDIGAFEWRLPAFSGSPAVTGTPAAGTTFNCAVPALAVGDGTPAVTVSWLRDGNEVAFGSTYVSGADDAGHSLACRVSASNPAGSVVQTSPAIAIPGPGSTTGGGSSSGGGGSAGGPGQGGSDSARETATLSHLRVILHRSSGLLGLTCTGPTGAECALTAVLMTSRRTGGHRLIVARVVGRAAVGTTGSVTLRLTAAGKRVVRSGHSLRASLAGTVAWPDGTRSAVSAPVTLVAARPSHS